MNCLVYRSEKKAGAYLYLVDEKAMSDVPTDLLLMLGQCILVMQLDLSKRDKLASENISLVKANLKIQGYHLQLPPKDLTGVINYGA